MRITAEISLYPLRDGYLRKIEAFIRVVRDAPEIEITVNQMSTQIRGELDAVVAALRNALEQSFAEGVPEVLVAKFVNADLPIGEAPQVE